MNLTHTMCWSQVPVEIGKLRNLSCLDLSQNKDIHHLPDEMGRLEYLFYVREGKRGSHDY